MGSYKISPREREIYDSVRADACFITAIPTEDVSEGVQLAYVKAHKTMLPLLARHGEAVTERVCVTACGLNFTDALRCPKELFTERVAEEVARRMTYARYLLMEGMDSPNTHAVLLRLCAPEHDARLRRVLHRATDTVFKGGRVHWESVVRDLCPHFSLLVALGEHDRAHRHVVSAVCSDPARIRSLALHASRGDVGPRLLAATRELLECHHAL